MMPQLLEHIRAGRGEQLFRSEPQEPFPNFEDVLVEIYDQEIRREPDGTKSLTMPAFRYEGQDEQIIVTTRTLTSGGTDQPKILYVPPYPFPTGLTKNVFTGRTFNDWSQEGVSPFEAEDSMVAPYRSARGAQQMYAGTIRMLHEQIREAHADGKNVGVFGFSFGANAISAYLNHVHRFSEYEREMALPEKVFVIEGGKIFESVSEGSYKHRSDPKTIAAVNDNPLLLPHQETLPLDVASRVLAIVNPEDTSVRSQSQTWEGGEMHTIYGTHARAPFRHLPDVRRLLRNHFQSLTT